MKPILGHTSMCASQLCCLRLCSYYCYLGLKITPVSFHNTANTICWFPGFVFSDKQQAGSRFKGTFQTALETLSASSDAVRKMSLSRTRCLFSVSFGERWTLKRSPCP